ncbi:alpha/beta hydrolase [Lacunimicrobium album]
MPHAQTPHESLPVRKRLSRRLFWSSSLVITLWLGLSLLVADYLTSRRSPRLTAETPRLLKDITYENLRLRTSDDLEIGAWYFPGQSGKPVILLLHGNFASRSVAEHHIQWLLKAGYSVMIPSLRAHGDSQGDRNDFGYSAQRDVLACHDWLQVNHPDQSLVVWGQSLGSAAAVFAANELGQRARAYILECPYQDLQTAVWNRCQNMLPDYIDAFAYRSLRLAALTVLPQFDNISPLKSISGMPADVPVLILAGDQDVHARPSEAQALHEVVKAQSTLKIFKDATHMGLDVRDKDAYRKLVIEFIDTSVARSISAN